MLGRRLGGWWFTPDGGTGLGRGQGGKGRAVSARADSYDYAFIQHIDQTPQFRLP